MTSSNGDIFRVTGHLCGKFTGPGEFPAQLRGDLMVSLICAWIHGWVNNGEAGDLKRHRAHYDVIVVIHDGAVGKMDLDIMLLYPWLRSVKLRGAYYMHTANVISPYWISHLDINSSPPGINGRHSQMIFQMHFLYEKFYVFIKISRTFIPLRPIDKNSIGLDNGLAPNRRQTIIWTYVEQIHWRTYEALGGDELTCINSNPSMGK